MTNHLNTPDDLVKALQLISESGRPFDPADGKYVIYVRKSTDEESKQVRSLQDQVTECIEFAERLNLKIDKNQIIMEAESAKEPDTRPKFKQLLNDLKSGKYDGVIAWHPDRLARNMKEAGEIIDLVDKGVIRDLKFVSFVFSNTPDGKLLLGITFALSKEYSDKLSENVSRGNKLSIKEGKYINQAKHGYYKDGNQRLQPDGNNFLLIKNSFKMRLEGRTLADIGKYLNESGYYKNNALRTKRFVKMDKQRVEKLMKDPIYTGVLKYGKNEAVNLIELHGFVPMLTVPEFMQINKLSKDTQLFKLARSYRKNEDIKADLMRGMIFCDECGESMTAGITTKMLKSGKRNYFYYRCESDDCSRFNKSVRAMYIIKYITKYLSEKPFSSQKAYDHYVEEMRSVSHQRVSEAQTAVFSLQAKKRNLEERLIKTKDMLISDATKETRALYEPDLAKIQGDIDEVSESIEKMKAVVAKGKLIILTYADFLELFNNMALTIGKIKNMSELDYIIKKMFLNFTVQGKNVVKTTLNSPFDVLETIKVSEGGRRGENIEPYESLYIYVGTIFQIQSPCRDKGLTIAIFIKAKGHN